MRDDFLKGAALTARMNELATIANENALLAGDAQSAFLKYVYAVGEALVEAKRRKGHRTKWTKWLRANFCKSHRTATVYMRVFSKWNDPRMVEARRADQPVTSLRGVLSIMNNQPLKKWKEASDPTSVTRSHKYLCGSFAAEMRKLCGDEVKMMAEGFGSMFLPKLIDQLRHQMCVMTESDYYEDQGDIKSEARQRVLAALNRESVLV